jgi:hypothetical protein
LDEDDGDKTDEKVLIDEDVRTYLIADNRHRGAKPGSAHYDPNSKIALPNSPKDSHRFNRSLQIRRRNNRRSYRTKVHSMFSNPQNIASHGADFPTRDPYY